MKQFAVVKKVSEVKGVQMIRHEISDGSLYDSDNCKIGCTAVVTAGKGRPVGLEIAGMVTKINPDPVNIHISCMD